MSSFFNIFKSGSRKVKPSLPGPVSDMSTSPKIEVSPSPHNNPVLITARCNPIGMSYWRNINAHSGRDTLVVALSVEDYLMTYTISKDTLQVIDSRDLGIRHTGEGIFFSRSRHDVLYVPDRGRLYAYNVYDNAEATIWFEPRYNLWQVHADYEERVFSATLRDANFNNVAWGVYDGVRLREFPIFAEPDECQIDKSGQWLLVKEKSGNNEYNRIIDILTGEEFVVDNANGAVGHSDNGFGCVLGENDHSSAPGALDLISFESHTQQLMYSTGIWNMGYVSFTNAVPGRLSNQKCLVTTPKDLISVRLDGTGVGKVITPNLSESESYEHRAKANLCPYGEYAVWTAFNSGSVNAYIIRVPNW